MGESLAERTYSRCDQASRDGQTATADLGRSDWHLPSTILAVFGSSDSLKLAQKYTDTVTNFHEKPWR